jgi:hypothetical protein
MTEQLTTNAPPVSVTRQNVTDALALLGLGFEGVSSVRIFLASDTIVVQWVEPKGRRRVSSVKVTTRLEVVR